MVYHSAIAGSCFERRLACGLFLAGRWFGGQSGPEKFIHLTEVPDEGKYNRVGRDVGMVRRAAIIASDIEAIDHAFALSASNAAWKAERHAPRGAPYSTEIS